MIYVVLALYYNSKDCQIKNKGSKHGMVVAINATQSKTVSIAYLSLKTSIFGLISLSNAMSMSTEIHSKCTPNVRSYFQLLKALVPLCILVDLCTLAYFFFSRQFKKIFYYVFYVFHWFITLILIIGGLHKFYNNPQCQQSYSLIVAVLSFSLLYQINAVIVMAGDLFIVLKYLHFGSNLVWLAIWYSAEANHCSRVNHALIAFIHAILSVLNCSSILISKLLGNLFSHNSHWRTLTSISLFMMLVCYLLILVDGPIQPECHSSKFMQKTYIGYGLLEMLSPLLLLIFLREEVRDLRDNDFKQQEEAFENHYEPQKLEYCLYDEPKPVSGI